MEKYEALIKVVINQFDRLEYSLREDLTQELRIFLYDNIEKFEETALDLDNYIFISLKRKVINLLKSKAYRREYSLNNVMESGNEYIEMFYDSENVEEIIERESILNFIDNNLSREDKKLIEQYYYNNLTFKKLGVLYNVSSEAVRKRLKKIIEKIRREA